MNTETVGGITYTKPIVTLLHATPLVNAELAGRVCYDSFESSEHQQVREFDSTPIEEVESSELLHKLCHTYFHESVVEHCNLTFHIKGTSRAVLMEHSRHRVQSISVRSTRYTMQNVLHAFNACSISTMGNAKFNFYELINPMDMFVFGGVPAKIEIDAIYDKLQHQLLTLGSDEFGALYMSKSARAIYAKRDSYSTPAEVFAALIACPAKKNCGDKFKWVVTDSWKVDMVVTFNLRSLKNYFTLRDSGSAYFGIRHLAQAMKSATPSKYLDLIVKAK